MSVKPPQQNRSRQTLDRIMDATEALLEDAPFERISIVDITRRAGVASGSFYTRFEDKNAVLEALFARYLEDVEHQVEKATAAGRWRGRGLRERVEGMVSLMVTTYRRRRGVSRAVQMQHFRDPERATDELKVRLDRIYDRVAGVLLGAGDEITHPDPGWAVSFSLQLVTALCRAKILFDYHPIPDRARGDDRKLTEELTRTVLCYLHADPGGRHGS